MYNYIKYKLINKYILCIYIYIKNQVLRLVCVHSEIKKIDQ